MNSGRSGGERVFLLAVFALALLARVIFLFYLSPAEVCEDKYWELGLRLRGVIPPPPIPFYSSPAYVFLAAGTQILGGNPVLLKLVQALVDSISCCLVFLAGRCWFSRTVSGAAALAAAVYFPLILYSASLLPAVWIVFFNLLALRLLGIHLRDGSLPALFGAGLSLGASLAFRPNLALFIVPAAAALAIRSRRRAGPVLGVFLASIALPLVPVTAWNARSGEFIPVTASGGWVFYTANNERANGFSYSPPPEMEFAMTAYYGRGEGRLGYIEHLLAREIASARAGRELSASEASAYWRREGLEFFRSRPREAGRLLGQKLLAVLNRYEPHDLPEVIERASVPRPPLLEAGLVFPLGLLGIFICPRRGKWPLYLYLVSYLAGILILYFSPRYRIPAVPVLLLFAAGALERLARWLGERKWGKIVFSLAALAVLSFLVWYLPPAFRLDRDSKRPAFLEEWRGLTLLRQGRPREARERFLKALEIRPGSSQAQRGLAEIVALGENVPEK